ncbi:MAG: flagellar biosynthesis protein FlhF [Baekduia sp.]|nr:flagellar biosynthesis protein FlhF [Baekduia sp.]
MTPQDSETFTYRGRSLEELVPRIRQDLGDDAVIVSRRETTTGGVGGFFAKREIEVEVRPGQQPPNVAAAFARQLADAHERQQQQSGQAGGADALRPAISPEVDALPPPPTPAPSAADVSVDDLFRPPTPEQQSHGLAALFNVGLAPAEPEAPAVPEAPEAPVERPPHGIIEDDDDEYEYGYGDDFDDEAEPEPEGAADLEAGVAPPIGEIVDEPEVEATLQVEAEVVPDAEVVPEPLPVVDQPTGAFDYLGGPAATPEPEPVGTVPSEPAPEPVGTVPSEPDPEPVGTVPGVPAALPPAALAAADRLVARGLRPGLAEAVAEEAMTGLAPLVHGADPKDLVIDALARRIPMHPLRRGPGVVGFVGPGGAGKTRCVARLAAAHARHGLLPVTVVALRSPDGGAELRRLLAPYGVALHAVESGAEGSARIAGLRGEGLVIVDTPGVSPRSSGELRALGFELTSLAPDELHLAVPATIGPDAARELVAGVRELGVGALVVTHTDETEILGTVIGLAIDSGLPLSYLARGQAVEAGLRPASAAELAADLVT